MQRIEGGEIASWINGLDAVHSGVCERRSPSQWNTGGRRGKCNGLRWSET
jgi:hypothetical protein